MPHKNDDVTQIDHGTETSFEAEHEAFHERGHAKSHHPGGSGGHDEGGGGHGGTEMGWLVSYADMMTLLFGLFVILFSLRTDKTKDADYVMRQISQQHFAKPGSAIEKPPEEIKVPSDQPPINAKVQAEKPEPKPDIPKYEKKISDLEAKIEEMKKIESALAAKVKTDSEPRKADPTSDLKKEAEELRNKVEETQRQLSDKTAENEKLKDEMEKNKSPHQTYMMVLLTWETEKHDLDLEVVTPQNKSFNFKRRHIASVPGSFELDSRFGPGIEMWKAENFTPGTYQSKISLYNKNGNKAEAKATMTVVTNLGTYKSPPFEVSEGRKSSNLTFSVDQTGAVSFGQ